MNNIFHILKWDAQRNLNLLRKSVDKGRQGDGRGCFENCEIYFHLFFLFSPLPPLSDKWSTEPAVVNAFYNPNKNDIGKA